MLDKYNFKVVDVQIFNGTSQYTNSRENDFFVFTGLTDGVWLLQHHIIKNGERYMEEMILPRNMVGLKIRGNIADFRKPFDVYEYGKLKTTDYELALVRVAREEFDVTLEIEYYHRDILNGKAMTVTSNGHSVELTKEKLDAYITKTIVK